MKWKCPRCGLTAEAKAEEVAHRCRYNKNKLTTFEKEKDVKIGGDF